MNTTVQFAIRVASEVTGLPQEVFANALAGQATDTSEFDPEELIAIILEIIMALIEQCPQVDHYLARVAEPSLAWRIWFRRTKVRPINDSTINDRLLAGALISQAGSCGAPELTQIFEEIKHPDFSVA